MEKDNLKIILKKIKISAIYHNLIYYLKIKKIHDDDKKASNSVKEKVSYLCAGILNDKLAFSQATVVFEK